MGSVLQLLDQSQQRYVSTANVEDSTAMAREAVDLMTREIRLAGYPPPSSYPPGVIVAGTNEQYVAANFVGGVLTGGGFLVANDYSIQFQADVGIPAACNGTTLLLTDYQCTSNTGVVSVINYELWSPTACGGVSGGVKTHPELTSPTLMRSQLPKNSTGAPVVPALLDFVPYINNVMNCTLGQPIFTYCAAPAVGATITPPWPGAPCPDMSSMPRTSLPAGPRRNRIVLIRIQTQTQNRDPQTQQFQIVEFFNVAQRVNPDQ